MSDFTICQVCGAPVAAGVGRRPRLLHENCKAYRKFAAAARRHLEKIVFYETTGGRDARVRVRRDLFAAANLIIPEHQHCLRGAGGRFISRRNAAENLVG